MTAEISVPARLAGGVWGHLVADALGVPYEFLPPDAIGEVTFRGGGMHGQPAGTWSDDGALMLALLDSLLVDAPSGSTRFDTSDQAARALAWADERKYTPDGDGLFDIGNATRAALSRLRAGTPAEQAGGTDERSNGNGSLMRILPLALVERDADDEVLVEHAHRASSVTHGHPVAQACCALYVLVARRLVAGEQPAAALDAARESLRRLYADDEPRRAALELVEGWTKRSGSGYVVDAFWSAWDAFAGADSYADTVVRAVRYGNDTDTTACIAGGLAGLLWGIDAIPTEWLNGMRGREIVVPMLDRVIAAAGWRTSLSNPIRVNDVPLGPVPRFASSTGGLGMTFLPGKQGEGWSGRHWRDLEVDAVRLRELGTDVLLLLVEDHELRAGGVEAITDVLASHDIDVVRFPIVDVGIPTDRAAFRAALSDLAKRIEQGDYVVVACRGGLGRTGTAVACLLIEGGLDPEAAIELTRASRKHTIEPSQEAFVRGWRPVTTGE